MVRSAAAFLACVAYSAGGAEPASDPPSVTDRLTEIETRLFLAEQMLKGVVVSTESVVLDPTTLGFGVINSGIVPLTVAVSDVAAYADGARIALSIGNPSSATLPNARIRLQYGRRYEPAPDGASLIAQLQSRSDWQKTLLTKEFTLTSHLLPGAWNSVPVALPGIKPDALGHLSVEITFGSLILREPSAN